MRTLHNVRRFPTQLLDHPIEPDRPPTRCAHPGYLDSYGSDFFLEWLTFGQAKHSSLYARGFESPKHVDKLPLSATSTKGTGKKANL